MLKHPHSINLCNYKLKHSSFENSKQRFQNIVENAQLKNSQHLPDQICDILERKLIPFSSIKHQITINQEGISILWLEKMNYLEIQDFLRAQYEKVNTLFVLIKNSKDVEELRNFSIILLKKVKLIHINAVDDLEEWIDKILAKGDIELSKILNGKPKEIQLLESER